MEENNNGSKIRDKHNRNDIKFSNEVEELINEVKKRNPKIKRVSFGTVTSLMIRHKHWKKSKCNIRGDIIDYILENAKN